MAVLAPVTRRYSQSPGFRRLVFALTTLGFCSACYTAIVITHGLVGSLGTTLMARLQTVYIILNIVYVVSPTECSIHLPYNRLCMVVIIVLPVVTPKEFINTKAFALVEFTNRESMICLLADNLLRNHPYSQWLARRIRLYPQLLSTPLDYLYVHASSCCDFTD